MRQHYNFYLFHCFCIFEYKPVSTLKACTVQWEIQLVKIYNTCSYGYRHVTDFAQEQRVGYNSREDVKLELCMESHVDIFLEGKKEIIWEISAFLLLEAHSKLMKQGLHVSLLPFQPSKLLNYHLQDLCGIPVAELSYTLSHSILHQLRMANIFILYVRKCTNHFSPRYCVVSGLQQQGFISHLHYRSLLQINYVYVPCLLFFWTKAEKTTPIWSIPIS